MHGPYGFGGYRTVGLGRAAGDLAERQVSLRHPRWWMATIGTALAGALLTAAAFSSA